MAPQTIRIWGKHAVRSALQMAPADVLEIWLRADRHAHELAEIAALAGTHGISTQLVPRSTLDRLSDGAVHQGVVLRRRIPRPLSLDELESRLTGCTEKSVLLVHANVQDPQHLGACLRIADGAGAQGVVTTRDRSVGMTSSVAKVASGAIDTVPVVQVSNLVRALERLKKAGFWIIGTSHDAETPIYECDLSVAAALVLGSESRGLRRLTREACDVLVRIPMKGALESLNISAAAAICLFEATRQRLSA
jgi:23S rRNA (guanosine2251-2'-O)-methyltransferase